MGHCIPVGVYVIPCDVRTAIHYGTMKPSLIIRSESLQRLRQIGDGEALAHIQ